jgi:hypothetical protein
LIENTEVSEIVVGDLNVDKAEKLTGEEASKAKVKIELFSEIGGTPWLA